MKTLNSHLKQESKFEPHHRSSSTKTMTDSWYINNNSKEEIDKNLQTDRHNNSFLDIINKKLESLENIDRSAIYTKVEKKSDSFLDLYERMKALNSPLKQESKFEPHHRSSLTKTMIDNWHINNSRKDEIEIGL